MRFPLAILFLLIIQSLSFGQTTVVNQEDPEVFPPGWEIDLFCYKYTSASYRCDLDVSNNVDTCVPNNQTRTCGYKMICHGKFQIWMIAQVGQNEPGKKPTTFGTGAIRYTIVQCDYYKPWGATWGQCVYAGHQSYGYPGLWGILGSPNCFTPDPPLPPVSNPLIQD